MMTKLFLTMVLSAGVAYAKKDNREVLSAACEQQIVDVVFDKLGRYDETFGVVGYKQIYVNHFNQLAIVKTSDENEPRDVLVAIHTLGQGKCKVEYKDTVGDGTTADIEVKELNLTPKTVSSSHFEIQGTIASVVSGEIDPNVIGDTCLIEVKQENGPTLGLLTSQYECDESTEKIKKGAAISVLLHKGDKIKSKKELTVLKEALKAEKFFNVPFNQIK